MIGPILSFNETHVSTKSVSFLVLISLYIKTMWGSSGRGAGARSSVMISGSYIGRRDNRVDWV